ncbi:hypothetical protein [Succinivibrio sp.]|uniref:hypothetical protein n=1 Tax=Succinivibrio sp. TaxID=2053619 RepID=UPI003865FBB5
MIKLKDLIKIMTNPKEFYLCILDEHDNMAKNDRDMVYSLCSTYDFKTIFFIFDEDRNYYTKERIAELLEYEVTCIDNWIAEGKFTNGGVITWGEELSEEERKKQDRISHDLFVYIAPIEKKKKKAKQEEQTDLFSDIDEVTE